MSDSAATAGEFIHEPVMVNEIVELFGSVPRGVLIDATLGGGGHAAALLDAHAHLRLVGLDQDSDALTAARQRLERFGGRAHAVHARFDTLRSVVSDHTTSGDPVVGVLFDLGVSSPQLDRVDRGFSHRGSGPLDMRMDRRQSLTAEHVVNEYDEATLTSLIRRFGDEKQSRRVARAIIAARPIATTEELATVVVESLPAAVRRHGRHPARRTFQAIRIEVNAELDVLTNALSQAGEVIAVDGRIGVLSYHSGEDRIVKNFFRELSETPAVPAGFPVNAEPAPFESLLRGGSVATERECDMNRRARSARLRAVRKCRAVETSA